MSRYSANDIDYAYEKIKDLLKIISDLENTFEGRKFTLDGHSLGSAGEVIAAYHYDIDLYPPSVKTHDGITKDGRNVQVKITQRKSYVFSGEPDYLIALHLNKDTGEITEVYNGPGDIVFAELQTKTPQISLNRLVELNESVPEHMRILAVHQLPAYKLKTTPTTSNSRPTEQIKTSVRGKSLELGYINNHQQKNCGSTGEPGNHAGQTYYWMECQHCMHKYKADGCDVWLRKCPKCMT